MDVTSRRRPTTRAVESHANGRGSTVPARRLTAVADAVVAFGVAGGLVATTGGYFGGHLSLVRKIGTTDAAFGPDGEVLPA